MKNFAYVVLLSCFFAGYSASAQTINLTGTVRNSSGDPLHFAFLQNEQKQGAFTDSLGNYSIAIMPDSRLKVNCAGYRDTSFVVKGNQTMLNITLYGAVTISGKTSSVGANANAANSANVKSTLGDAIVNQNDPANATFSASRGDMLPVFNPKEETQGSRYLLKGWAHGFVINDKGETVQDPHFLFAYDKMGGGLLLTKDKLSAIEIDRGLVTSFTLYDNSNIAYAFENVPQIDKFHYSEVISAGNKYKIYKFIKTTFVKSNYSTDGVMAQGNNYDEYVDEPTYYVYDVKTNALQKITLKKKAIKEGFASDADKISKFMSDHSSDTIDESYLASLGEYMNE